MSKKQRLELTWIGKDERPKLEPRVLVEDPSLSYCGKNPEAGGIFDNMLIKGDNLLALKALEQEYGGQIRCIFIDPPYNTGAAWTTYDDGLEHSVWLSMMRDRVEMLRELLSEDGSIWISVDDNEAHHLKVLMDEVFGRDNFVASIVWEKADSPRNSAIQFSTDHDYILVYSRNPAWNPRRLPRTAEADSIYSNPDDDPRGPWLPGDPFANKPYSRGLYVLSGPTGREFRPPPGRYWRTSEERLKALDADGRIWWGPNGDARPSIKRYLSEVADLVPRTLWNKGDVGSNRTSKNEMRALFPGEASFDTPKPERLIERVLRVATNRGDIVLDSFAGSGTTGAVAHKMGRRWIMVELGDHADTLIVPRLEKVIEGDDPGGVTESVAWQGGGGFRYYTLAPSLLEKDRIGNWVISKKYDANMLAHAICKLMGFTFEPSQDEREYWRHGYSTETDFIYVTTQSLTYDALKRISEDVGPKRTLLICCKAFRAKDDAFDNLTLKKIPQAVLKKCEWGRDDYSLKIAALQPEAEVEATGVEPVQATVVEEPKPKTRKRKSRKKKSDDQTPDMFAKRVEA